MTIKATERKTRFINKRSHALNATRRTQKLNKKTVIVDGKKIVTTVKEAKKTKVSE